MARPIHAPRGTQLTCKNWLIEAPYRMIQNNLDPAVAFDPDNLIVYGGRGRAARNWPAFEAILDSLRELEPDETLLVQSGKPVAVFRTHEDAPRLLIANSLLVPKSATWEYFWELEAAGLVVREVEAGPPVRVSYALTGAALSAFFLFGVYEDPRQNLVPQPDLRV